jgi:hypothetical protein
VRLGLLNGTWTADPLFWNEFSFNLMAIWLNFLLLCPSKSFNITQHIKTCSCTANIKTLNSILSLNYVSTFCFQTWQLTQQLKCDSPQTPCSPQHSDMTCFFPWLFNSCWLCHIPDIWHRDMTSNTDSLIQTFHYHCQHQHVSVDVPVVCFHCFTCSLIHWLNRSSHTKWKSFTSNFPLSDCRIFSLLCAPTLSSKSTGFQFEVVMTLIMKSNLLFLSV